ncbi:hypothetical protein CDEST_01440 [Colletotrichum destructivum]|uniref:Transmembrane protein n=1 Tax=Colletotrichum destructivum TaxID=34406 RepID=A0AAX4HZW8_9PEZI|nr:hypothetical protein CDEST_01440 [Colletotrichum destructivum]
MPRSLRTEEISRCPESLSHRKRHETRYMPLRDKVMAPRTLLFFPPSPLFNPLLPRLRLMSVVTGLGSFQNVQGRQPCLAAVSRRAVVSLPSIILPCLRLLHPSLLAECRAASKWCRESRTVSVTASSGVSRTADLFFLGGISLFLSGCLSGGTRRYRCRRYARLVRLSSSHPGGFPGPFVQSSGRSLFHLQTPGWPVGGGWGTWLIAISFCCFVSKDGRKGATTTCQAFAGVGRGFSAATFFLLGETWRQAHTSYIVSARW